VRDIDRRVLGHIENNYVIRKFPGTTRRLEAQGLIERTGPLGADGCRTRSTQPRESR